MSRIEIDFRVEPHKWGGYIETGNGEIDGVAFTFTNVQGMQSSRNNWEINPDSTLTDAQIRKVKRELTKYSNARFSAA